MSSSRYRSSDLNSSPLTLQELKDIWNFYVVRATEQEQKKWRDLTDEEFNEMLRTVKTIQHLNEIMKNEKVPPTLKWSKLVEWSAPVSSTTSSRRRRFGGSRKHKKSRKHKRTKKNRRSRK
uniref:Uncharacterized protein n=1 Tax=viral metagenome TaxID=1070528 RepID=A0A6C0BCA5_9ZZZZ